MSHRPEMKPLDRTKLARVEADPLLDSSATNPSVSELRANARPGVKAEPPRGVDERIAFWWDSSTPVVYVVAGEGVEPVKIGTAVNLGARLRGLQTGSPVLLRVVDVIPGGHWTEATVHRALRGDRLHGEWFQGDATDRFLQELPTHAEQLTRHYFKTGEVLRLPPGLLPPEAIRKNPSGMKPGRYGPGNVLGHRWRTQTGELSPVKVRYTEPGSDFQRHAA